MPTSSRKAKRHYNLGGAPRTRTAESSDDDHGAAAGAGIVEMAHGVRSLGQRPGPIDDRREFARLDDLVELAQRLGVLLDHERRQLLTHQRGQRARPELPVDAADPSVAFATDDDEPTVPGERATQPRDRGASAD